MKFQKETSILLQSLRCVNRYQMVLRAAHNGKHSSAQRIRKELFENEKSRKMSLIKRIEKITVKCQSYEDKHHILHMNKNISTPYACAMHLGETFMNRSALALVDGQPWDMHKPLEDNCEMELLHFLMNDPSLVNQAFWRTGSFILGYIMDNAFKDEHKVQLYDMVNTAVESGSFAYDVTADFEDWTPSHMELRTLSQIGAQISHKSLEFQPLEISADRARTIFSDNSEKLSLIDKYASKSDTGETVTVYAMGDHVDLAEGPLISNTSQIGRFSVCSLSKLKDKADRHMYRVQGVCLPKIFPMQSWTYRILEDSARHLNEGISEVNVPSIKKSDMLHLSESPSS